MNSLHLGCDMFTDVPPPTYVSPLPAASAYDPGTHLPISNVSIYSPMSPTKICVRMKASKTDPFHQGVTICLGRTGKEVCPVGGACYQAHFFTTKVGSRSHMIDTRLGQLCKLRALVHRTPQLPHWLSNIGGCGRSGRCSHRNTGQMEKFGVHRLHTGA